MEGPDVALSPDEDALAAVDPEEVYRTVDAVLDVQAVFGEINERDFQEHLIAAFRMATYAKACEAFTLGFPTDRVAAVGTVYATRIRAHAEGYLSRRH